MKVINLLSCLCHFKKLYLDQQYDHITEYFFLKLEGECPSQAYAT